MLHKGALVNLLLGTILGSGIKNIKFQMSKNGSFRRLYEIFKLILDQELFENSCFKNTILWYHYSSHKMDFVTEA